MTQSTQVTARKWRPKSFSTLVGQQHVLQPLINALTQQRLHHAYLFTGTRGVGKTTIARILAKCFNCEQGVSAQPCGQCSACLGIDAGCFVDVIEVDAASRTKVEDTRELLDNVQYLPTQGRFKIYIIDEVHMLSTSSFNALLKTLEEPPEHVKFLLATTDPQKLPVTVLSRCLQFHLKHLDEALISQQLAHILSAEKMDYEPEALSLLAQAGQGSMRDALSLLDQAIAHGAGSVRTELVRAMLGSLDPQTVLQLLSALQKEEGPALLAVVDAIAADTGNFEQALQALIQALHDIALIQIIPKAAQISQPRYQGLKAFAEAFSPEQVQLYYQIALHGRRDLPWAPSGRAGFEMTCMRLLAFVPETADRTQSQQQPVIVAHQPLPKVAAAVPVSAPAPASLDLPSWEELLPKLKLTGMASALASHCVISSFNGHLLVLHLAPKHAPLYTKAVADRIAQALSEFMRKTLALEIKLQETQDHTPAQRRQEADEQAFAQAKSALEADPIVRELVEKFDAKLDETTVKRLS